MNKVGTEIKFTNRQADVLFSAEGCTRQIDSFLPSRHLQRTPAARAFDELFHTID